jgi:hypothetical protein
MPNIRQKRNCRHTGNGILFGTIITSVLVISSLSVGAKMSQSGEISNTKANNNVVKAKTMAQTAWNKVKKDLITSLDAGNVFSSGASLGSGELCSPANPANVSGTSVATTTSCSSLNLQKIGNYTASLPSVNGVRGNKYQLKITTTVNDQTYTVSKAFQYEMDICTFVENRLRDLKIANSTAGVGITDSQFQAYARKPCMLRAERLKPVVFGSNTACSANSDTISTAGAVNKGDVSGTCQTTIPDTNLGLTSVAFRDYNSSNAFTSNHVGTVPRYMTFRNIESGAHSINITGPHQLFINNINTAIPITFRNRFSLTGTTITAGTSITGSAHDDRLLVPSAPLNASVSLGAGDDIAMFGSSVANSVNLGAGENLFYSAGNITSGTISNSSSAGYSLFIFGGNNTGGTISPSGSANVALIKTGATGYNGITVGANWARKIFY